MGGHTVDIDTRNLALNVIPHAKFSCYMSSGNIQVRVRATGYLEERFTLYPSGTTPGYFKRDVFLQDYPKTLIAEDMNGKKIVAVYFQKDQYGFDPRQYGITAHIPKKMWKNADVRGVEVFDNFWGFPLKKSCEIEAIEDYYRVKLTISRNALELTGSELTVVFDTKEKLPSAGINDWLARLKAAEDGEGELAPGAARAFAEFLFYVLPRSDVEQACGGTLPKSLKVLYDQARDFAALHRDPTEK